MTVSKLYIATMESCNNNFGGFMQLVLKSGFLNIEIVVELCSARCRNIYLHYIKFTQLKVGLRKNSIQDERTKQRSSTSMRMIQQGNSTQQPPSFSSRRLIYCPQDLKNQIHPRLNFSMTQCNAPVNIVSVHDELESTLKTHLHPLRTDFGGRPATIRLYAACRRQMQRVCLLSRWRVLGYLLFVT